MYTKLREPRDELLFSKIDVEGKSFVDVGAYDGITCKEAIERGASPVLGIDYIINEGLKDSGAEPVPMDIFSEKWLFLPKFDVVSCQGVFYHVPDIVSLFTRLRMITGEVLFLEGHFSTKKGCFMEFKGESMNTDFGNWWTPTEDCLHKLLKAVGFNSKTLEIRGHRICIIATLGTVDLREIMPRKTKNMGLPGHFIGTARAPVPK